MNFANYVGAALVVGLLAVFALHFAGIVYIMATVLRVRLGFAPPEAVRGRLLSVKKGLKLIARVGLWLIVSLVLIAILAVLAK
jgi:hypothetical protein